MFKLRLMVLGVSVLAWVLALSIEGACFVAFGATSVAALIYGVVHGMVLMPFLCVDLLLVRFYRAGQPKSLTGMFALEFGLMLFCEAAFEIQKPGNTHEWMIHMLLHTYVLECFLLEAVYLGLSYPLWRRCNLRVDQLYRNYVAEQIWGSATTNIQTNGKNQK